MTDTTNVLALNSSTKVMQKHHIAMQMQPGKILTVREGLKKAIEHEQVFKKIPTPDLVGRNRLRCRTWYFHHVLIRRELILKYSLRCVLGENTKHGGNRI